jgi:predicted nucleic acid-binding protein
MEICFDTSTLVSALVQQHPHHALAFPRLREVHAGSIQGYLTTHGLAELFATLTALPLKPRLLPMDVNLKTVMSLNRRSQRKPRERVSDLSPRLQLVRK